MDDNITALGCTNEKLADFLVRGRVIAFNHISPLDKVEETDVTLVRYRIIPVGYTACIVSILLAHIALIVGEPHSHYVNKEQNVKYFVIPVVNYLSM